MCDLVKLENMIVAETFSADLAFVGFLLGVGSQMHLELFAAGERFVTMLARVRPVPGVEPHVDDELEKMF